MYSFEHELWATYDLNPNYAVSTFGNVLNKTTGKTIGTFCPYRWTKNACGTTVHRMAARMFLPNDDPINKSEVDHISDEVDIELFNHVNNLQWITVSENRLKRKMNGTAVRQVRPTQKRWEETKWTCDKCKTTIRQSSRRAHLRANSHLKRMWLS